MSRTNLPTQLQPRRRIALGAALLLAGITVVAACGKDDTSASAEPGNAQEVAYKNGCPTADVLKPILNAEGGAPFISDGSGPWRDTGWFCRYATAARNPMGWRLNVYYEKPESPGKAEPASGPYAFSEFGPAAYLHTSCKEDGGDDRLSIDFARKGEEYNSQELVFEPSGDLIDDCDRQVEVMRALTKVFYDHQIGEAS